MDKIERAAKDCDANNSIPQHLAPLAQNLGQDRDRTHQERSCRVLA